MSTNLFRRAIGVADECPICLEEAKDCQHLLCQCPIALEAWKSRNLGPVFSLNHHLILRIGWFINLLLLGSRKGWGLKGTQEPVFVGLFGKPGLNRSLEMLVLQSRFSNIILRRLESTLNFRHRRSEDLKFNHLQDSTGPEGESFLCTPGGSQSLPSCATLGLRSRCPLFIGLYGLWDSCEAITFETFQGRVCRSLHQGY